MPDSITEKELFALEDYFEQFSDELEETDLEDLTLRVIAIPDFSREQKGYLRKKVRESSCLRRNARWSDDFSEVEESLEPVLTTSCGQTLFYRGCLNGIFSHYNVGKTWVLLFCVIHELSLGRRVLWLNFDSEKVDLKRRLKSLKIRYPHPRLVIMSKPKTGAMGDIAKEYKPHLVVIDGVTASGCPVDGVTSLDGWRSWWITPFRDSTTFLLADHSNKSGLQIGSIMKGADMTGAQYELKGKGWKNNLGPSTLKMILDKDKVGDIPYHNGETVAYIKGESVDWKLSYSIELAKRPAPGSVSTYTDDEKAILKAVDQADNGVFIGNNELRSVVGIGKQSFNETLNLMIESGSIIKDKKGKHTTYSRPNGGNHVEPRRTTSGTTSGTT